jgi:outer membrane receptor protein involved in Fe transport
MAAFISQQATTRVRTKLSQAHGAINGDTPLQLWAKNPVSFAVGAEYRKYYAQQRSDTLAKTPGELGGAGGAAPDITGAFDVYEGFAEVIAPIISDRPFFDELQVEAGIRRSHYTIQAPGTPKFNTTTWKVAGSWAPVRDLKFRGNYQRAVRAPNIGELFTPVTGALVALSTDPCQGGITDPNLVAVCLAQGAPAGSIGSIAAPTSGQAQQTTGGNIFLKPETAKTWTVGAVVRPRFIPGLNATVDYYNIKVDHAITLPAASDVINACFAHLSASSATDPACTSIRRNPTTGQLSGSPADTPGLPRQLSNSGKLATDGIDFTLDYRRGLGTMFNSPAKIALALGGNWTHANKFQANPQSINRDCNGYYSVNCNPAPRFGFNERTTLSLGRVDLSVLWRYIGPVQFEPLQMAADRASASSRNAAAEAAGKADPCPDFEGADLKGCLVDPAFRRIKGQHYFDFTTRFNVNEHFELTFTIENLFDKDPPVVGNTIGTTAFNSGNTYPSTYDPLGRRFAAGARIKF